MATAKGGATGVKKGKKPHKNKPTSKKYSHYAIENDSIKRKLKHCPRCGAGVFLANHKTRLSCGKCYYTEFLEKK
ncbi:30S ribosomal protein S27ae [Candidatus Pacearchaeota archaeon]|nr:30S ribosomal protein S27ae [Candidatus Pacearchaeota archaeon]